MNKWMLFLMFFFVCVLGSSQSYLSCSDFFVMMDTCDNAAILDVRTKSEYIKERIPGAFFVGEKKLLLQLVDTFDKQRPILIYCEYGKRSESVYNILHDNGFTNLYQLKRGLHQWKKKGYPVDQVLVEKN
ncbi:rhodanese-like domain-containing protein [Thermophagus sp. OGC60D27]|uniref:rhodanese-like domain-containing protein n=1 Tax=Thermophagus sp. OGC60D27 TaxID=3458415 RepID=UPI004037FDFE